MMSEIISPNSGLFFMKVGLHAGEAFEQILERKRMEYKKNGHDLLGLWRRHVSSHQNYPAFCQDEN